MRVIVTGATGFIGHHLVQALRARGDEVTALTRDVERAKRRLGAGVGTVEWRPAEKDDWMSVIDGADAVVNLAGEPVADKRWTPAQKTRILASRVEATRAIVAAIERAESRPSVLVSGSAIGYYGSQGDTILTEESPPGKDFLAQVVQDWENAARPVVAGGTRLVLVRTGIVLGADGGALPRMLLPFKLFGGGSLGSPDQWVSWIHVDDEIGLILRALNQGDLEGPINLTAPNPVCMRQFAREIGAALHRPSWNPFLGTAMRLVLGERAGAVMSSQRVVPKKAEANGYQFRHTDSGEALRSLLGHA